MADPWESAPIVQRPPRPTNRSTPTASALASSTTPAAEAPRQPQTQGLGLQTAADPWEEAPPLEAEPMPMAAPPVAPVRQVGVLESAGRTAAAAAIPIVRSIDMAAAGLAGLLAPLFGLDGEKEQQRIFQESEQRSARMRQSYEPQPGEEMSLTGQLVGGVASMPVEVLGGLGLQRGVERSADVVQRGGDLGEAAQAGLVTGGANVAANLLPVKAGGKVAQVIEGGLGGGRRAAVATGAATGAALGIGGDRAVVASENAALPEGEQFADLQAESNAAVSGGLGAALGALGAAAGAPTPRAPRKARAEPKPAPGTKASGGAAGTDMATQRRERAEALPVPIKITKGQAERTFEQQRFEKETAKDPDLGGALRENADEQNARVIQNLEAFEDLTGREETDRGAAGRRIIDPIERKAESKKAAIRESYEAARDAGELEQPVDTAPLVRYLEKNRASARNAGVLGTAEDELVRLGGATRDADGNLQPGTITLNDFEELRKTIGVGGKKDATNSEFAGQLRRVIDSSTEGAGGDLYKAARKQYADYAAEFTNQGVIRDLLKLKKNTTDRTVAFDNVFKRTVLSGDPEELRTVKRTLLEFGEEGRQGFREIQGQAMKHLRELATSNSARDSRGNPIVSADKFDKALKAIDRDGRLEDLFGKKGAEQLRDVNDLLKDIYTAPPGAVNTSNTASVLIKYLGDIGASTFATGVPLPLVHAAKAARDLARNRKVRKQVREALGPDDKPLLLRKVDPEARPFEPVAAAPAAGAAPAPKRSDPRLTEIDRLREGASPETLKVLDERAKAVERQLQADDARAARDAEAVKLDAVAAKTTDPELRAALVQRANKLRSEKIPTGEAEELPPVTGRAPDLPALPIGKATELTPLKPEPDTPVPAPEARELTVDEADALAPTPRETELARLRSAATDPAVRKDLDRQIAAERKRGADRMRGDEYLRLADEATDPTLKADLEAKAAKLGATRDIPTGDAAEIDESAWRAAHNFGTLDADRAKALARALEIDDTAARAAVVQHQQSPRAFDRQIERILEQGDRRESQSEETAGSGRGLQPSEEGGQGSRGSGAEDGGQGRRDSQAPAAAEAEGQAQQVARAFERATEPTGNPITDALSARLRTDYEGARAEYDRLPESDGGRVLNTDIARELSPVYRADRTRSADVHEPASAFIKRVYADKLAAPTPEGRERVVMLTAGGTGAGKTSAVRDFGDKVGTPEITFDTNMNTLKSAVDKIDQALAAGRDVRIFYVYTDPVESFRRALGRAMRMERAKGSGRTVPISEHVKTHVGASRVMRELADRYRNDLRVELVAVDNSRASGGAQPAQLADLPLVGENGLREQLTEALDQAHRAGDVSDAVRAGFLAASSRVRDEGLGRGGLPADERRSAPPSGGDRSRREGPQGRVRLISPARDEPAGKAPPSGPVGATTSVVTERGLRVPVRYRLLDAAQLITSHDDGLKPNPAFPQEFQPRDRSRDSSEAQIARIENGLQPELLADSPKASDGAPIIGPDGLVESGNARTIALRRAYRGGKADAYRDWLADNAERFGLTPDQVTGMQQPVLVRERTVDVDRADFARQANESAVSTMSETEQAVADARQLPDLEGLVTNDDGTLNIARSVDFIRDFMRTVPGPNERNQLMAADGRLSQRGAQRIRNAVFAKAYGDADLVSMLTETTDGNVKNLLAGLLRSAPGVAKVRELAEAGARSDAAFVPDLIDAVRRFSALREDGMTVRQYLGQGSLIGGEASPRVAELLRQLELDSRAPRRVADMVQRMVEQIDAAGDPRQSAMFEEPAS